DQPLQLRARDHPLRDLLGGLASGRLSHDLLETPLGALALERVRDGGLHVDACQHLGDHPLHHALLDRGVGHVLGQRPGERPLHSPLYATRSQHLAGRFLEPGLAVGACGAGATGHPSASPRHHPSHAGCPARDPHRQQQGDAGSARARLADRDRQARSAAARAGRSILVGRLAHRGDRIGRARSGLTGQPAATCAASATPSRSSRWSPTRKALAIAVSAGLTALMLGKQLVSTTYRLSSSCARQLESSAELSGSSPKRQVPAWWATPATGIAVFRYAWRGTRWCGCMPRSPSIDFSWWYSRSRASSLAGVYARWIRPSASSVTRLSADGRSSVESQKSTACSAMLRSVRSGASAVSSGFSPRYISAVD